LRNSTLESDNVKLKEKVVMLEHALKQANKGKLQITKEGAIEVIPKSGEIEKIKKLYNN
jgi:hypothetical protein